MRSCACRAEFGMESVEKTGDVLRLSADAGTGPLDDLRFRPRRCAMLMPAEAPGTPMRTHR